MKNNFLQEMQKRGYLNQCTNLDELSKICKKNPISGYIGFLLENSLNLSKFVH